jgi:hypothetical protein
MAAHAHVPATGGSDPCSSSGIMCTQPQLSSGSGSGGSGRGSQLPVCDMQPGAGPAPALDPSASAPLAALWQLWQQQGAASPLLALLGTPGAHATPGAGTQLHGLTDRGSGSAAAPGVTSGMALSPWLFSSWQPGQVAGAAKGATPRFVSPGGGGSPTLVPPPGTSPLLSLLNSMPSTTVAAAAAAAAAFGSGGAAAAPTQAALALTQQQHHRLARVGLGGSHGGCEAVGPGDGEQAEVGPGPGATP